MRMLIIFPMSLALLVAGCGSGPQPQGDVEVVRLPKQPNLAPPPHDFRAPHARAIPSFYAVGVPETARTIAPFKQVKVGMLLNEAIKVCGLPDGDWGNLGGPPSHILIWDLKDGSWVSIRSDGLKVVEEIGRGYPIKVKRRSSP
jgi:hypothetical protein